MLASVKSYALEGLDGYAVSVEVDVNSGLPTVETVGLASTATKESKERVRAAIRNSGFLYPMKRITVNLAPADIKRKVRCSTCPSRWAFSCVRNASRAGVTRISSWRVSLRSTAR